MDQILPGRITLTKLPKNVLVVLEFCIRLKGFFLKQHFWVFIILCSSHILSMVLQPGAVQVVLTNIGFVSYKSVLWGQSITVNIKVILILSLLNIINLKFLTYVTYILVYSCINTVIACYHQFLMKCSKLILKTMNTILGMLPIFNILKINLNLATNPFATKGLKFGTISQIISETHKT